MTNIEIKNNIITIAREIQDYLFTPNVQNDRLQHLCIFEFLIRINFVHFATLLPLCYYTRQRYAGACQLVWDWGCPIDYILYPTPKEVI